MDRNAFGNVPNTHSCTLSRKSFSCLPKLPPHAGYFKHFARSFRKIFMASRAHPEGRLHFNSYATLQLERKRHVRQSKFYIIHPFSKFYFCDEVVSFLLWNLVFFKDPFIASFYSNPVYDVFKSFWTTVALLIDIIFLLNICIWFVTGYSNCNTNEVTLDPKKVALRYLKTYFVFDFLGAVPFNYVVNLVIGGNSYEPRAFLASSMRIFRLVRMRTMLKNLKDITMLFRLRDIVHEIISISLLMIYCVHWSACMLYYIPKAVFLATNAVVLEKDSWVEYIFEEIEQIRNEPIYSKYSAALRVTISHFFGVDVGSIPIRNTIEQYLCTIILVIGYMFYTYTLSLVFLLINSATKSTSKFEEKIHEISLYSKKFGLGKILEQKLVTFYYHRFQKKYFHEKSILDTLTEHLQFQIYLHTCQHVIQTANIFKNLPDYIITEFLNNSYLESFIKNELIRDSKQPMESIFIVSRGSVTILDRTGKEIKHLEDSDSFGELEFMEASKANEFSYVAVENSEVIVLSQTNYTNLLEKYEEFQDNIKKIVIDKSNEISLIFAQFRTFDQKTVLSDLKKGKILEQPRERKQI